MRGLDRRRLSFLMSLACAALCNLYEVNRLPIYIYHSPARCAFESMDTAQMGACKDSSPNRHLRKSPLACLLPIAARIDTPVDSRASIPN